MISRGERPNIQRIEICFFDELSPTSRSVWILILCFIFIATALWLCCLWNFRSSTKSHPGCWLLIKRSQNKTFLHVKANHCYTRFYLNLDLNLAYSELTRIIFELEVSSIFSGSKSLILIDNKVSFDLYIERGNIRSVMNWTHKSVVILDFLHTIDWDCATQPCLMYVGSSQISQTNNEIRPKWL